ncbi:MAG: hypothetical protein K8F58_01650 [Bauldia sp.]|nr:hypothetical protein [Bauldia sp.]
MLTAISPGSNEAVSWLGFGAMGLAGWLGEQSDSEHIAALHRAGELPCRPSP